MLMLDRMLAIHFSLSKKQHQHSSKCVPLKKQNNTDFTCACVRARLSFTLVIFKCVEKCDERQKCIKQKAF